MTLTFIIAMTQIFLLKYVTEIVLPLPCCFETNRTEIAYALLHSYK